MKRLAELTTLRVGGPAARYVEATNENELLELISQCDSNKEPLLIIGGGSNLLVSDDGFDGTVVEVSIKGNSLEQDACSGGMITVAAGEGWDAFVHLTLDRGFADVESLSGIPGKIGAAPIQNIGAYGHEIAESIARVRTYDRLTQSQKTFAATDCGFGYRTSRFKREPNRWVILDVTFQLRIGELSAPIAYQELANYLGVALGERVRTSELRKAVLELRESKGMVWRFDGLNSAGSFFVNPIISTEIAATLPKEAPRWVQDDGRVKTSAAWLIERSGITKGFVLGNAAISPYHVLALTNPGQASASDIIELARFVRAKVQANFGITLVPEPTLVGVEL